MADLMPRPCTVCVSKSRGEIEAALIESVPFRHIAARYGTSTGALQRHANDHLPARLLESRAVEEVADADNLLLQLRALQGRTLAILADTETSKDHPTALRAIGEARRNLELLAKLTELLGPETAVTVNIAIDQRAQQVILSALEPFPEARIAVAEALIEVEGYEE